MTTLGSQPNDPEFLEITDDATDTTWRFERRFLESNWTCIWGRGCLGILETPSEELAQGCCSLGAHLDPDEAMNLSALAAVIDPSRFQYHRAAQDGGVFSESSGQEQGWHTRVVDDACIFLNRPGFEGGTGCALHLEAMASGESPTEWKPSVCWQLPVHVDWSATADGTETAEVRAWSRANWGEHGKRMAWVCTEEPDAYVGTERAVDSLAEELTAIVGTEVYVQLRARLD